MNKNDYSTTKNIWKPKHCWHTISYYRTSKTSCKLSKTITQAEKVSQVGFGRSSNSLLYSEIKKEKTLEQKKCEM